MTTHTLPTGQMVIEELASLGQALGYSSRTELPTAEKSNPPAVDVAWMREGNQRFPLMILEVESAASNSAAYSPVKVFGPRNTEFEKPLFFFHVFLEGGEDSSRINDLQSLFGTYNYRAYRLRLGEAPALLADILSQHRRVSVTANLRTLGDMLGRSPLFRECIPVAIPHAISLGFHDDVVLSLAQLCAQDRIYEPFLRDQLSVIHNAPHPDGMYPHYPTYFGATWSIPVHLGLLQYWTHDTTGRWVDSLRNWQENRWHLTQIGPHFGLSRDYDDFVFTLAPPFLGLVAGLMKSDQNAGTYIAQQCLAVLDALQEHPSDASMLWSLWILHITAAFQLPDPFNRARRHLNEAIGGVPENELYCPPGFLCPDDDTRNTSETFAVQVPSMSIFQGQLHARITKDQTECADGLTLALGTLLDDECVQTWAWPIVRLLGE